MDVFLPLLIIVILFILFSICGWCCKRKKQGIVYGPPTNITTQTSTTAYGVTTNAPYPVDQPMNQPGFNVGGNNPPYPTQNPMMPMPAFPPAPGPPSFGNSAPYPPLSTPYPPAGAPYPTAGAPYPPAGAGAGPVTVMNPPSYAEAVGQPPTNELYAKQAPYNPNFDKNL